MQKIIFYFVFICIIISTSFFAGVYFSTRDNKATNLEYEARLSNLTSINNELKNENKRITELNTTLTERLGTITNRLSDAKKIIDGLNKQAESDGDAVQRLIESVSIIEQAIKTVFESY